ncbi:MAG: OmpA family protein [Planctomycetota bacterium]|jgi:hypothetical protein
MKRSTVGALILVLLGAVAIGVWYLAKPWLREKGRRTIRIAGDGYLGYWFITSPEMRKRAASSGITIDFTDDGGAYAERLKKFADGEYDAIVLPVNSYLEHGGAHKFPGAIVAAISESKGADGIVGFTQNFPSGSVSELNNAGLKVVYTSESPSSFLLDLTIVDFDLFNLAKSDTWRVEVGGSREAFQRAKKRDGEAFVMWEPELSQAIAEVPGLKYIWGSDKFGGYIIDVFVFRRDYLKKHEAEVIKFFESYFMAMRFYASNPEQMLSDIKQSSGLKREIAETILPKIDWFNLHENCRHQFGLTKDASVPATEGVVNCIIACTDVLTRTRRLASDPLDGNPYFITDSSVLQTLMQRTPTPPGRKDEGAIDFTPLSDAAWGRLPEVGTMRVEPITFQTSRNLLDDADKEQVDKIANSLVDNYPDYRVAVCGHTAPGDEEENRKLSRQRAEAVVQRLIAVHGVDTDRLHAEGCGSSRPPDKRPGESPRAYRYRLPRVEFVLLEDNPL